MLTSPGQENHSETISEEFLLIYCSGDIINPSPHLYGFRQRSIFSHESGQIVLLTCYKHATNLVGEKYPGRIFCCLEQRPSRSATFCAVKISRYVYITESVSIDPPVMKTYLFRPMIVREFASQVTLYVIKELFSSRVYLVSNVRHA